MSNKPLADYVKLPTFDEYKEWFKAFADLKREDGTHRASTTASRREWASPRRTSRTQSNPDTGICTVIIRREKMKVRIRSFWIPQSRPLPSRISSWDRSGIHLWPRSSRPLQTNSSIRWKKTPARSTRPTKPWQRMKSRCSKALLKSNTNTCNQQRKCITHFRCGVFGRQYEINPSKKVRHS